jgi:hypothetical protein
VTGWLATIIGGLIVGSKYYSIHVGLDPTVKTFFVPVLLILIGVICLWKFTKD